MLLASNSLNPSDDDLLDNQYLDNVNQWSSQIDLRKDLWKYLEITTSSIKEWKNTFINKVCSALNLFIRISRFILV